MYYVYLLESQKDKSWYIGYTSDLKKRLYEHLNKQGGKTTSKKYTLKLIYYEAYVNIQDAKRREMYFKTSKGKTSLKTMLEFSTL